MKGFLADVERIRADEMWQERERLARDKSLERKETKSANKREGLVGEPAFERRAPRKPRAEWHDGKLPKRRHKWAQHPDAPNRPFYQQCQHETCKMVRADLSDLGVRWEYRDRNGRFIASRRPKDPAPPCERMGPRR